MLKNYCTGTYLITCMDDQLAYLITCMDDQLAYLITCMDDQLASYLSVEHEVRTVKTAELATNVNKRKAVG